MFKRRTPMFDEYHKMMSEDMKSACFFTAISPLFLELLCSWGLGWICGGSSHWSSNGNMCVLYFCVFQLSMVNVIYDVCVLWDFCWDSCRWKEESKCVASITEYKNGCPIRVLCFLFFQTLVIMLIKTEDCNKHKWRLNGCYRNNNSGQLHFSFI